MKRKKAGQPDDDVFYSRGLQFECLECGRCCTGFPGYVYLSQADIEKLAAFLRISLERLISYYTRPVTLFGEKRVSLVERSDYRCIFWKDGCTVYSARPYQCMSYPFWKRILISKREWVREGQRCPGIDRGRVYSKEEIEKLLSSVPVYDRTSFDFPVFDNDV